MTFLRTPAVVLRDYELSEQDKIVVFYSLKSGLIKVVVKGARRIKSRFAPAIQFPSYNDLLIYKKENSTLGILSDCKVRCSFPKIRKDILRFAYASYVAEVFLSFLEEGETSGNLFYLLVEALSQLEQGEKKDFKSLICAFGLKLLYELGYKPELERCISCGKHRNSLNLIYFSPSKGGILCKKCYRLSDKALETSRTTLLVMDRLLHARICIPFSPEVRQVEGQIIETLEACFLCHFDGKRINSLNFIQEVEELLKLEKEG